MQGDRVSRVLRLELSDDGQALEFSDCTAALYVTVQGESVALGGTVSGSTAEFTLTGELTAAPGVYPFEAVFLSAGDSVLATRQGRYTVLPCLRDDGREVQDEQSMLSQVLASLAELESGQLRLSQTAALALSQASAGESELAAREDHTHPLPTPALLGCAPEQHSHGGEYLEADAQAADAALLGGLPPSSYVYTHPDAPGSRHIPSGGSSGQALIWLSDGAAQWGAVQGGSGNTQRAVLWVNQSPTAQFLPGNITLPQLADYDVIEMFYNIGSSASAAIELSTRFTPGAAARLPFYSYNASNVVNVAYRALTCVGASTYAVAAVDSSASTLKGNNAYIIPLYAVGYKY